MTIRGVDEEWYAVSDVVMKFCVVIRDAVIRDVRRSKFG